MRLYQITELEQLTGIKAHTIRIWEKRHNLIEPDRTTTNYRRYNDEQVKKLLNISTLQSKGYKISKIAALTENEIHKKVLEIKSSDTDDVICNSFVNDLIKAMICFNEASFEKTYSAVLNRFGMFDSMINVFYPLLNKIGLLWSINDVSPAQEHFASCLMKRKIMSATDGLAMSKGKKNKFLLFLVPGELHEISLLFANYIIRSKGYETVYLGQDVPYENISVVVNEIKPKFILTFFTTPQDEKLIYNHLKQLHLSKDINLLVCGRTDISEYLNLKLHSQIVKSPQELLTLL
ncbi:MAG: MerR family transcriptional regulator [Bacteroidota bacterium]